jgi:hypothetical protein
VTEDVLSLKSLDNSGSPEKPAGNRGKTVVLAEPRSFCAGVQRAIDIVEALPPGAWQKETS